MKQGSKLRRKLKACCLFRPTYCLPLVRCQRWLSPGLNDRGKGKRNSCGKFLQRKAFGGSETRVFLCFKAISKDDYVLEGGNVALSLSRFWEEISPGVITLRIKDLFISQKVKIGGGKGTFAALSLWYWVVSGQRGNSSQVCFPDTVLVPNL